MKHTIQYIKQHISVVLLPLLLAAVIPPLFLHLGTLPMQLWDEARIAVSAQEMMHNHDLLVVHYGGQPDMWSVKPPLMIWLQALSMSVFGMHEWATRLPGAMASTATCLLTYLFLHKKAPLLGLIAVLILITSQGFVTLHCSRTGDYDTVLTFFCTAYCLCYFTYLAGHDIKHLYATFLFLILAALTKGIAALLFLPALFLFTLYKKQLAALLKNCHFYIGLVGFFFTVVGYYLLREHYNPGYIKAVQENELGGRYAKALEHNRGVFLYYYNNMVRSQFRPWIFLFIPGVLAGLFIDNKKYRDLTVYLLLLCTVFFLVISSAQTKLYWYAMPMYPFLAIIAAFTFYSIFILVSARKWIATLFCIALVVIFIRPYKDVLELSEDIPIYSKEGLANAHMTQYLQEGLYNKQCLVNDRLVYAGYQANLLWYTNALENRGQNVHYCPPGMCKVPGNIIVFQDSVKKYVETHYQTTILQTYYNVTVYRLNDKRQ